jgi:hypothetical protein
MNKFPFNIPTPKKAQNIAMMNNEEEDLMMVDELTPVSTPTEQLGFNFNQYPEPPACGRTASVSSIASSVSNFSTTNDLNLTSFANHYKLTESFENLLFDTYQIYQTNPTVTPFNEINPPSGVINKVTKEALKIAVEKGIEVGIEINNYSLTIIRQKLIQLCKSSNQQNGRTSRTNSMSSMNGFPSLNLQTRLSNNPQLQQPLFDLRTPTEGFFSFETPLTPVSQQQPLGHKFQETELQPSFLQEPVSIGTPPIPSGSPSNEFFVPDGLFNATSNRKRESLRLKRSGNKTGF